ncbi:MAG: hypothetical protein KAV42_11140 [Candidatus Krumholzibacteria bacterium]|nr:hypothetical protein [Candidatus Krumholzibacteria bacterium]
MIKRLVLVLTLAALLGSTAEAVTINRGKRGRRCLRYSMLESKLKNDKSTIYHDYGHPRHRIRVRGYGRVLEHWTYYEVGKEFIFDEDSRLVETRKFWPEDRRERFKR